MRFDFVDGSGQPVVLSEFFFTYYDLDQETDLPSGAESLTASGFVKYDVDPNTELDISTAPDGSVTFSSTRQGTLDDNPTDPLSLTSEQLSRSVTLWYRDTSTVTLTYSTTAATCTPTPCGGRNFLFAGVNPFPVVDPCCLSPREPPPFPAPQPPPPPPLPVPPSSPCICASDETHNLMDFSLATLQNNNLGGAGPDPDDSLENMHLASVGMTADGESFDLIITSETEYVPRNAANHNRINGAVPQINLGQNETVTLRFDFVDGSGQPVVLSEFFFTYYDLDQETDLPSGAESLTASGFVKYDVDPNTELDISTAPDGSVTFSSTRQGTLDDNPTDPLSLTSEQLSRSVTLWYRDTSTVTLTYSTTAATCTPTPCGGRNFLFAGVNPFPVVDPCCLSPREPPPFPAPQPPPPPPLPVPPSSPCICASDETHNLMTFGLATLQTNNLGGAGPDPDDSPENMHLASVGMTTDGESFDLIITSETEYVPRNAANHNRINGAVPQINLGQNETVTLRFDFVDGSGQPVVLSEFFFTYYDLDQETDLPSGAESLTASGFIKYDVDPNTELDISTAPDGSVTFSSTRQGTLDDNPTDPLSLTSEQLSRSVTLWYRDTSTVTLTYSTTAATCTPTPCGGRNFLFAGVNPFPVVDPCCRSPREPPPFPAPQPPPPPPLPVPPSSPCICASDETHNLMDFSLATLQNNNLGGAGPDPNDSLENMHLASVGMTADGESFDLIITSETEYVPRNAANHNRINGAVPQINLGQNETVTLRFDFVDGSGQPVVLSEFFFTYYDLDQETDLPSGAESLTASGFIKYDVDPNTELDISTAPDGSVTFSSTRQGTLDDNPTDPLSLTSEQLSRSVTLWYRDTSTVTLTYSTTAATCTPTPCGGRNFLFAGVNPFPVVDPCCLSPREPPPFPAPQPPPPPPLPVPPSSPCICASDETHNLMDFSLATLQNNNLGGAGPDPDDSLENMHLASVGMTTDGESFDLIITSETEYVPRNAANHNRINGAVPQINLGQNETVTLRFDFVDGSGQPVVLSEFFFTYYDLDQETDLPSGAESLTASGFVKYDVDPNTELDISTAPDGSVTFSSTRQGTLDDNPTDPLSLTSEQLSRSVTLWYRDTSTVTLTYSTTAATCTPTPCGGRNFLFAGVNPFPVVDPCCLSPREPPPFPAPQPPPPPPLPVPPSSPCICASDETHNLMDFGLATLQNNNLGGAGPDPDDSPENMHLASVGMTTDGESFDLIITSETEYVPRNAANHNRINGAVPQINLGQNETVTLRFDFVDGSGQPVVLSEFFFTYYDLDQETDLPSGAESLTASGFIKYDVDPNTELDISTAPDGSVTFSSTRQGTLDDNPTDPLSLTSEQLSRSVTLWYRDTSTVTLTYSTTAATCTPTPCGGRNFLFAGVNPFPVTHNLMDFSLATLQNNNLGGAGPDPNDSLENMHLASVGMTADGESFDLIITSETEYVPRNAANHNRINGAVPQINLGQNETVTLRFDFVDGSGQPVVLSEFFFTYYDLDQETDLPSGAESLTASGFIKYDVDPNTELDISTAPDGSVTFSSTRQGTLDDNPTDPLSLTSEQLSRSVTLWYRDTST
ncbi:hypothetical protein EMIHUDRAFT_241129, partial [Emiliania huxleyi CCMP1516]|uniref:Uncharacterized protein n=2 Tax=Emiliania huxleyi TaxID=2903 RepID=A0A0D3JD71_EMIH1